MSCRSLASALVARATCFCFCFSFCWFVVVVLLLVVLVTRDEPESELDFRAWEGVVPRRDWVVLRVLPRRSGALVFFLDDDEAEAEDVVEGAGEEDEPLGREAGVLGGV